MERRQEFFHRAASNALTRPPALQRFEFIRNTNPFQGTVCGLRADYKQALIGKEVNTELMQSVVQVAVSMVRVSWLDGECAIGCAQ
jgi:hypothetical protein